MSVPDKRLIWEYKDCKIVPVACYRDTHWGKETEPIDFGCGPRSRYWLVNFPDKTWIHVATKPECRAYIDKTISKHQRLDPVQDMARTRLHQIGMTVESYLDSTGEKHLRVVLGRKSRRIRTE